MSNSPQTPTATLSLKDLIVPISDLSNNATGIVIYPQFNVNASNRAMEILDRHDAIDVAIQASPAASYSAKVFMGNYFSGTTEAEALAILARIEPIAKAERTTFVLGQRDLGYVHHGSIIETIHTGKVGDKITEFMREHCKPVGFFPVAVTVNQPDLYRVIVCASGFNKKWLELATVMAAELVPEGAEDDTCFEIAHKLWNAYLEDNKSAGELLFRTSEPESMFWGKPEPLDDFIQCVGKHICTDEKYAKCSFIIEPGTEKEITTIMYTINKEMYEGGRIPIRAMSYILDTSTKT